jgi:pseudaminic acid synthase
MKIGNFDIGAAFPPFIIAEMSGNHNQSLEKAIAIIDEAAAAGADAIKLQTYTADTITLDSLQKSFFIRDTESLWQGKSLHALYTEAATPWEWHEALFEHARKKGLLAFSSPFDNTSVDFLENLSVPAYKIASFENNHLPLIAKVASTGKPLIISTGISNLAGISEAVETARNSGSKDIALLKCTSSYPASPEDSNLLTIPHMAEFFQCVVGLSDHTMGIGASVAAVALGARIIEKHFTLSRADGGVDAAFSLEPDELKSLVTETKRAFQSLGKISYEPTDSERKSLQFKRSIYVAKDIKKGEVYNELNLRIVRPGDGLHPRYFEKIIGKTALQDVEMGTPLTWEMILA